MCFAEVRGTNISVQINHHAVTDFAEGEGLRLTDLQRRTAEMDPEGKGVSISFLSELSTGKRTECSPRVMKMIADALGVRVRSIAAIPVEEAIAS